MPREPRQKGSAADYLAWLRRRQKLGGKRRMADLTAEQRIDLARKGGLATRGIPRTKRRKP